jgi:hypothetical protein
VSPNVKDILSQIRKKRIEDAIFLWEHFYNKAIDEVIDICLEKIKQQNDRAADTIEENKATGE